MTAPLTDVARLLAEVERLRAALKDNGIEECGGCATEEYMAFSVWRHKGGEAYTEALESRATKAEAERDELRAQSTVSRIAYETLAAANAALRSRIEAVRALLLSGPYTRREDGLAALSANLPEGGES